MTPSPETDNGFARTILREIPGMSSPKVPGWPTGFPTGCACRVTTGFPTPQGRGEPHGHPWKRPVDNPWMWPQGCAPQGKHCGVGRACCTLLGRFIEIFIFCLYAQERQNTEKEALYAAHRRRIGCGRSRMRPSRGQTAPKGVHRWRTRQRQHPCVFVGISKFRGTLILSPPNKVLRYLVSNYLSAKNETTPQRKKDFRRPVPRR